MRHRKHGRKLGRNASHRKALFRNMASHLIRTVRIDEDDEQKPKVPGRIVTTLGQGQGAASVRRKAHHAGRAGHRARQECRRVPNQAPSGIPPSGRNGATSEQWNRWNQAIAPAVALRRRAFAILRDRKAVDVLFR